MSPSRTVSRSTDLSFFYSLNQMVGPEKKIRRSTGRGRILSARVPGHPFRIQTGDTQGLPVCGTEVLTVTPADNRLSGSLIDDLEISAGG